MITLSSPSAELAGQPRARPGLLTMLGRGINELVAFWMRRAALRALRDLDDRSLRDIGIRRDQIGSAVQATSTEAFDRFRSQW